MSRELTGRMNGEINEEMNEEINRKINEEIDVEINRETNWDINKKMNKNMNKNRNRKAIRKGCRKTEKNNLDEMQEQKMLHIEKNSFWILYLMIAVSIVVQKALGRPLQEYAVEGICFLTVSVIMVGNCIMQGIWDRRLKADGRTNLLVSLLGSAVAAVITTFTLCGQYPNKFLRWRPMLIAFVLTFLITFVICMVLMNFCTFLYKKRLNSLESQDKEDDDTDD